MFQQASAFDQQLCWVLKSGVSNIDVVTGTASATVKNDGVDCTRPTLSCGPGQFDRNKGGMCKDCCSGFQFSTSCLATGSRDTVANACQACPPVTDATANSGNGLNCQNFECSAGKYYNGVDTSPNDNTGAACVDCDTDATSCAYNEYGQDVCLGAAQGITRMTGALTCATCTNTVPSNADTASYGSTFGVSNSCTWACAVGDWYDSNGNTCATCTQAACSGGEYRKDTCTTTGVTSDSQCEACTNLAGTNYHTAAIGSIFNEPTSCAFTCDVGEFFDGVSCTDCETDHNAGCSGAAQGTSGTYLSNQCTSVRESSISVDNVCTAQCTNVPSGAINIGHSTELGDAAAW